MTVPGTCKPQ
ncbi:hypothetical protein F383_25185 [Gossypium arboreum]|uniref:Uncharacterized protein n=1 Tax=Gossypium arboreum TaxID=29729 RepID=A0A0B0MB92_GOSAR|nr:hypothetical protein F383_37378 [Gossypium arboreum]KHG20182.1 hypothetical protein F383_25185 [Gossypium arboreum]